MNRKSYKSPVIFLLDDSGGIDINVNPSQGTSGFDSQWTFDGIDSDTIDLIDLNCDDFDLQAMDADGNYVITKEEFDAWFDANQPW